MKMFLKHEGNYVGKGHDSWILLNLKVSIKFLSLLKFT